MTLWEIALVLGVALIVIKPERLPEIALTLGRFLRMIRTTYQNLLNKLHTEL